MSGKINKNWKSVVCAGIVALALAGGVREARAESHQNYFPLNVGNSWTYVDCNDGSTKTFTIIGKEEMHGHTYYRFDDYFAMLDFPGHFPGDDILFRYDPNSDKVFEWCPAIGKEEVRYDFSGDMWGCGNQLIGTGISYTVPAGQFDNCYKFWYGQMCDGGEFYETLAPGVGNIRHEAITYDESFELQSYTIMPFCGDANHPYPVGDLNHDCCVNLLDLAILASHWLERTVPECDLAVSESDITFSNPNPASGEEVTMTVTVHNIGGVDAGEFVVYISLSCSLDGIIWTIPMPWDWITVPHLPAGSSTIIYNRNVLFPCCMCEIMVWVDREHQIQESNEGNNHTAKQIEIQP